MLRLAAFLLLTCWVASDSGAALAQPGTPNKCSYSAIVFAVRAGQTPDVSGCSSNLVFRNLQEAGFRPVREPVADGSVERGMVSRVAIQDRIATIYVSTGAAPPQRPAQPALEEEPTPAPPTPVIADPTPAPQPPLPPQPPAADPAPSDPPAPATDPAPPDPPVPATDPVSASPPIDGPITVNPDDPALTNTTGPDTTGETEEIETSTNTADDNSPPPPPTWFEQLQDKAPWWPIPVVILGLAAIAYGVRKLWPPGPPLALYPTWAVDPGAASVDGDLPTMPGWPRFSTRTTLEWGGASLPDPLPTAEKYDG